MLANSPVIETYAIECEDYLENCNCYSFQKIILFEDGYQFETKIIDDLNSKNEGNDAIYKYVLFEDVQLSKNGYWDMNQRIEFLFNLVELLDVTDKFELLRKIHLHDGPYIIKVKRMLRNIGRHPILESNLSVLHSFTRDLSFAELLKYYD